MKKHTIINIIMALVYVPFSFFSFLCGMAGEATLSQTNPLICACYNMFAWTGMLTSFATYPCLFLSQWFFDQKNNPSAGRLFRFLPPIVLTCAGLLCWAVETIVNMV